MDGWTYDIIDTQSGLKKYVVWPLEGSQFARQLNGIGEGTHTFYLPDSKLNRSQWQDASKEWARTLVVSWNGTAVYAGVITGAEYETATRKLTLSHAELRTFLSRRFPFGIGTYAFGTISLTNRSLRGLVYQIVIKGTQGDLSLGWNIPIYFPMYDENGPHSRDWFNYQFVNIEAAITELQNMENGPDIDFQPRWVEPGRLDWVLRVGSPSQPRLDGPSFDFNVAALRPGGLNVRVRRDGVRMVTGVFSTGDGFEADRPHGEAAVVAVPGGIPSLDVTRSFTSTSDVGELNAHSRAEVEAFRRPTVQWSLDARAADVLPGLVPGSSINLFFDGDPFLDDGWQRMWSFGFSSDGGETVSIKVQEQAA